MNLQEERYCIDDIEREQYVSQRVLEQDICFKVYCRGRLVLTVQHKKDISKTKVEVFEENVIHNIPAEDVQWKDISRFLCSRINYPEQVVPIHAIKKNAGRMVGDDMYIRFLARISACRK